MQPEFKSILCAHGMEPNFPHIYQYASSLANRYDGRITVLHALEPLTPYAQNMLDMYLDPEASREMREQAEQRTRQTIEAQLEKMREYAAGGRPALEEIRVVEGKPGETLLKEADRIQADVIVMGSHRHTAMGELLLGSTAHRVTQHASVPVLLVRPEA